MLGGYPWSLAHDSHSSHPGGYLHTFITPSPHQSSDGLTSLTLIIRQNYFCFNLTSLIEIRPHSVQSSPVSTLLQPRRLWFIMPGLCRLGIESNVSNYWEILYITERGNSNFYLPSPEFLQWRDSVSIYFPLSVCYFKRLQCVIMLQYKQSSYWTMRNLEFENYRWAKIRPIRWNSVPISFKNIFITIWGNAVCQVNVKTCTTFVRVLLRRNRITTAGRRPDQARPS